MAVFYLVLNCRAYHLFSVCVNKGAFNSTDGGALRFVPVSSINGERRFLGFYYLPCVQMTRASDGRFPLFMR